MWGTIVNTAAIIAGGTVGLFLNKNLPQRYQAIIFQALGLFTLVLGVSMALKMEQALLCILSLILGGITGELLNLEVRLERLSNRLKAKVKIGNERFTEGFITSTLLFCVGAMAIVGAVEEGSGNYPSIFLTKSVMDGFSSIALAAAMGVGVLFSSLIVFGYQAGLTALVIFFGNLLSSSIINEVAAVGGILIVGLGINLLKLANIKIVNLLPSIVIVGVMVWIFA